MHQSKRNKVWSSFQYGFGRTLGAAFANFLIRKPVLVISILLVVPIIWILFR